MNSVLFDPIIDWDESIESLQARAVRHDRPITDPRQLPGNRRVVGWATSPGHQTPVKQIYMLSNGGYQYATSPTDMCPWWERLACGTHGWAL